MLALHRVKMEWAPNLALELEWASGQGRKAVASSVSLEHITECEEEVALDTLGQLGLPAIAWRPEGESLFEPLQLRESTEYLIDITVPGTLEAATAAWLQDRNWPLSPRLARFYRPDPPRRWQVFDNGVRITGRLNFGSYVGLADFSLFSTGVAVVEVACTKIGYFGDFCTLLDQIAEESVGLLFEVDAPTYSRFSLAESDEGVDPAVLLFHFRRLMNEARLPLAIETILYSPHNTLGVIEEITPLSHVRSPSPERLSTALSRITFLQGGPLAPLFRGYSPESLPEQPKQQTEDTLENRYVKAFLEDILQRVESLANRLERAKKHTSAREATEWSRVLSDWLSRPLWHGIGRMTHFPSNSQVLQRRHGYREVLQADLSLQFSLRLPWSRGVELADGLDGDLRPISELYEYWCFFVLRAVLRNICGPENVRQSSLLRATDQGLALDLRKGADSKVAFEYRRDLLPAVDVSLFYNRTFRRNAEGSEKWDGSYSAGFHPDYSILVEVSGDGSAKIRHWLHFDAKYRLDIQKWRSEVEDSPDQVEASIEEEITSEASKFDPDQKDTFKRGDLYKMHTYRDALLSSRGAYILFPGSGEDEEIFIRHPGARYPSAPYHFPSVGAFQLRPYENAGQRSSLEQFITAVLVQITSTTQYQEEKVLFT